MRSLQWTSITAYNLEKMESQEIGKIHVGIDICGQSGRTEREPNEEVERYKAGVSDLLVEIGTLVLEGVQCTRKFTHRFPAHSQVHRYKSAIDLKQLGSPTQLHLTNTSGT